MIFGKTNKMIKKTIVSFICLIAINTFGQSKDANTLFAQAEEQFAARNYEAAISKVTLYENLSNASKEKAQILKIQIYREIALKDKTKANNYNNAVEVFKKMYADGKKVNADDLYRILKEQQEFNKDAATQGKDNLSSISSDISIDGIKIGMNVEDIPQPIASNFDWSQGIKGKAHEQLNYVQLIFMPKKAGSGGAFNYKPEGIQSIIADDRTRRVIEVMKFTEYGKYKKKDKTGFSKYNQLLEELKAKYGESNVTVNQPQITTTKIMNREMTTESHSALILSKSVSYTLAYSIVNDNYSIIESIKIPDYIKN